MAAPRKHPEEVRERAVRLVFEWRRERNRGDGGLKEVGGQLGVHPETLRNWLRQADIDNGRRPGPTTDDARRIAELEREVRELRRRERDPEDESAFFARELDPRPPR
jgi:transposase